MFNHIKAKCTILGIQAFFRCKKLLLYPLVSAISCSAIAASAMWLGYYTHPLSEKYNDIGPLAILLVYILAFIITIFFSISIMHAINYWCQTQSFNFKQTLKDALQDFKHVGFINILKQHIWRSWAPISIESNMQRRRRRESIFFAALLLGVLLFYILYSVISLIDKKILSSAFAVKIFIASMIFFQFFLIFFVLAMIMQVMIIENTLIYRYLKKQPIGTFNAQDIEKELPQD
jgi:predicted PurR-regulated permease PerM